MCKTYKSIETLHIQMLFYRSKIHQKVIDLQYKLNKRFKKKMSGKSFIRVEIQHTQYKNDLLQTRFLNFPCLILLVHSKIRPLKKNMMLFPKIFVNFA